MIKIIRNIIKRFNLNKNKLSDNSIDNKIDIFNQIKKIEFDFNFVELLINRINNCQNELLNSIVFDKVILYDSISPLTKIEDCLSLELYINDFNKKSSLLNNTYLFNHNDEIKFINTFLNQGDGLTEREKILLEVLSKIICQSHNNISVQEIKQSLLLNLYKAK